MPEQTGDSTIRPAADLTLSPHPNTARSALTCRYRCGDACSHDAPNRTLTRTSATSYNTPSPAEAPSKAPR